jgi:hypothetical protein
MIVERIFVELLFLWIFGRRVFGKVGWAGTFVLK